MDSGIGFVIVMAILGGLVLAVLMIVLGVIIAISIRHEGRKRRKDEIAWREKLQQSPE